MLSGASSLFYGCQSPVGGRICSPVVGVDAPRSTSELRCEVGRSGTLPLGEELLSIPPQELSTRECTLWCCLSPVMQAHKVQFFSHCPRPCLNCGNSGNRPGCPRGTVLTKPLVHICWHRITEVRHQDGHSHTPGPALGTTESAQTPAPPLHVCVCSNPLGCRAGTEFTKLPAMCTFVITQPLGH